MPIACGRCGGAGSTPRRGHSLSLSPCVLPCCGLGVGRCRGVPPPQPELRAGRPRCTPQRAAGRGTSGRCGRCGVTGRAPSAHGQAVRAAWFWHLTFPPCHLRRALQALREDGPTSCLVRPQLGPAAGSSARAGAAVRTSTGMATLAVFCPPCAPCLGKAGEGKPGGGRLCQGRWPPLLSPCAPPVSADALAPSLRGWFSGLEVPSVLLNAG